MRLPGAPCGTGRSPEAPAPRRPSHPARSHPARPRRTAGCRCGRRRCTAEIAVGVQLVGSAEHRVGQRHVGYLVQATKRVLRWALPGSGAAWAEVSSGVLGPAVRRPQLLAARGDAGPARLGQHLHRLRMAPSALTWSDVFGLGWAAGGSAGPSPTHGRALTDTPTRDRTPQLRVLGSGPGLEASCRARLFDRGCCGRGTSARMRREAPRLSWASVTVRACPGRVAVQVVRPSTVAVDGADEP
jgi:hypothetical protein